MPYLIGVAALLFTWLLCGLFSRHWNPVDIIKELATGDDNSPSPSKFQFVLWTGVAIFSFITIWYAQIQHGNYNPIETMPANLLVLMGISVGAMVGSKAIVAYHLSHGTAIKKHDKKKYRYNWFKYIICDDDGDLSLNKLQMIAWTFIAIVIYLAQIIYQVGNPDPVLPDVADSLLVLMGVSQGAYLGKRLVTSTTPTLQSISKSSARPDDELMLTGQNFGVEQAGSIIKIEEYYLSDDKAHQATKEFYPSKVSVWKDDTITFNLPLGLTPGAHNVSVIVGGKESKQLTCNVLGNET